MWVIRKDLKEGENWKGKSNDGEWGEKIIENYGEIQVIGEWGSFNTETKEQIYGGKILGETIKYIDTDGKTKIGQTFEPQDLNKK